MSEKSPNTYGYEKSSYDDCIELILATNRRHMEILNLWFLIIAAIYLFFSWQNMNGLSAVNAPFFLGFLIYEIVFMLVLIRFRRLSHRVMLLFTYVNLFGLLLFGIVCSAAQPYMAATMYLVILVIVALSYIDKLLRMGAALLLGCTAFLIVSYQTKPGTIMNQDIFNVIVVLLLSMVFHYLFQRARMREFITFQESTRMQHELEIKSSFDALTSLLNRGRFFSMAGEALRQDHTDTIVMALMDLDKFKEVNDTLGHQMGDKVIQEAGRAILNSLSIDYGEKWSFPARAVKEQKNFAGRLGGDEFVVLIRDLGSEEEITRLFEGVLRRLNEAELEGLKGIHASIGVTRIAPSERDVDSAYTRADAALYRSKEAGRNQVTISE